MPPKGAEGTLPNDFAFSSEAVRDTILLLFDALYDLKQAPLDREEMRSVVEQVIVKEGDPLNLGIHLGVPPRRRMFFLALSDLLARGLLERSVEGFWLSRGATEEMNARSRDERRLARKAAEAVLAA